MRLLRALADACPEELCVMPEPAVMLGPQTEFDPDLVMVRMEQIGGAKFTEPPLLNPDPLQPELTVFELRDGSYALVAKATGSFTADHPYTVSIDLADLTRGLRH
jgi:hypothetical protein